MARVLVTGGAGFIGSHTAERLLERGDEVRILDNFDPFYDTQIKRNNLKEVRKRAGSESQLEVVEGDFRDPEVAAAAVAGIDKVIHLAALAGVRPSIQNPIRYMDVNVAGTQTLLEALVGRPEVPIVFASSSSVYGGNEKVPFSEEDPVDHPVSPYAASKKAGEVLCYTFHHLHGNPLTCLRFFTVYGPRQRPEMAIHMFTRRIMSGDSITLFGDGSTSRDYTFIEDIVDGVIAALDKCSGYKIYNLGGTGTTTLGELVSTIEAAVGKPALIERLSEQPGDVRRTMADLTKSERDLGYRPKTTVREGVSRFVAWYLAEREAGRIE